ncbi:MAG: hypothetical protein AAB019_07945 [Planctomycetota bacterium]
MFRLEKIIIIGVILTLIGTVLFLQFVLHSAKDNTINSINSQNQEPVCQSDRDAAGRPKPLPGQARTTPVKDQTVNFSRPSSITDNQLSPIALETGEKIRNLTKGSDVKDIIKNINHLSDLELAQLIASFSLQDISKLSGQISKEQIREIIQSVPEERIYRLTGFIGISQDDIEVESLDSFTIGLIQIADKETRFVKGSEPIYFSAAVKPDNTPEAVQSNFTTETAKIYACFGGQGTLTGLRKVMVRWINKSTGELIFVGARTISPDKLYNYVSANNTQNWPKGTYQVQLFKISSSLECIAQGTYQIE